MDTTHRKKTHWLGKLIELDLILAVFLAALIFFDTNTTPTVWASAVKNFLTRAGEKAGFVPQHIPEQVRPLNEPLVLQRPELPRGCEVTTLTMLLQSAGIKVDKMALAKQLPKVSFKQNGVYGSPEKGFVGDMYHESQPGYGVYHQPLAQLAGRYLPDRVIDLTGHPFSEIEEQLSDKKPVLIIINTTFRPLDSDSFQTWQTSSGKIRMTYYEHAVLLTGYNKESVFFNNPLGGKNVQADKTAFIQAWQQLGSQAISYRDRSILWN